MNGKQEVEGHNTSSVRWPSFMHILKHPALTLGRVVLAKRRADRQPPMDSSYGPVKEAGVAYTELEDQFVHGVFEFLRIDVADISRATPTGALSEN